MSAEKEIKPDEVEEEQLYSEIYEEEIVEPFNPKDVDIISQPMVISNIVEQLKYEDILLETDFQRHPDLWSPKQQSRLIESLIIKIPLPTFYFDSTKLIIYYLLCKFLGDYFCAKILICLILTFILQVEYP